MNKALVISKLDQVTVDIETGAITHKQDILTAASAITSVANEFDQDCAVDCLREMNALVKLVEKSRTEIKAPVLDVGRRIDSMAKDFSSPVSAEIARVNRLVTDYQVAERKKAEEAERVRQAELLRIEAEQRAAAEAEANRLEAIRKAEEAKRQAEEDAATAFNKRETAAAAKALAQAEADRLRLAAQAEAERRKAAELERERLQAASAMVRTPDKPSGLVVKTVWKFEVTDLWLLAKDNRDLVRLEANASAINEAVRNGMRACPGIRIYSETVTGVRT